MPKISHSNSKGLPSLCWTCGSGANVTLSHSSGSVDVEVSTLLDNRFSASSLSSAPIARPLQELVAMTARPSINNQNFEPISRFGSASKKRETSVSSRDEGTFYATITSIASRKRLNIPYECGSPRRSATDQYPVTSDTHLKTRLKTVAVLMGWRR